LKIRASGSAQDPKAVAASQYKKMTGKWPAEKSIQEDSKKVKEWEAGERPEGPMDKNNTEKSHPADKAMRSAKFEGGKMVYSHPGAEQGHVVGKPVPGVGGTFAKEEAASAKPSVPKVKPSTVSPPPIPSAGRTKPPPLPTSTKAVKGAMLMPLKSMEKATNMLKDMVSKASEGNPAKEPGPVSGSVHGGKGPACTGCPGGEEDDHPGKGPAKTSVAGPAHGGKGPAQTSVSGSYAPGNEGNMSKAMTASAMPRMPRAMAMAMDTWRSATNVLTRGNSKFVDQAEVGPLTPTGPVQKASNEQVANHNYGEVLKSCGSCGRTYRIYKGMEDCPTCSMNKSQHCSCGYHLVKSHGGHPSCPICG